MINKNTPKLTASQWNNFIKKLQKLKRIKMASTSVSIVGLCNDDLMERLKTLLEISEDSLSHERIFFCGYSEFTIPIGHIFNSIHVIKENISVDCKLELKRVTQQFFLPYDEIPKGHKTICKFEFLDDRGVDLVMMLPKISDWYESERILTLYT